MSSNNDHPESNSPFDSALVKNSQPWTDETVSLFWKYENERVRSDSFYFSYQCGRALVALAKEFGILQGKVLDFSAARGHLVNHLLGQEGITVEAVEYTDEAVNALKQKFEGRARWKKASILQDWLKQEPSQYDTIFCIEVIEHLIEPHLNATFQELFRAVAPGGSVFLTTPNEEALEDHFAFCPFCRTEFHPVQHVRSFSASSLRQSLEETGFEVSYCQGLDLNILAECLNPESWKKSRFNYLKMQTKHRLCQMLDSVIPGKKSRVLQWIEQSRGPNLMAIATKPTALYQS